MRPPQPKPGIHWPTALQFSFSALGSLLFWSLAIGSLTFGGYQLLADGAGADGYTALFLNTAGLFFLGIALLPSAWFSFLRLMGHSPHIPIGLARIGQALIGRVPTLVLVALVFGAIASQNESVAWLLLPILHVAAVSLIMLGILRLAIRGIAMGSAQRVWGVLAAGLTLGPLFSIIFEVLAGGIFLVIATFYAASQPQLASAFSQLIDRASTGLSNPELLLSEMQPLLSDPILLALVLGLIAFVVPLIEELLKPIGVWLLLGRNLSPASGFALGALSGAGFALAESLTLGATTEGWLATTTARIGTSSLHILTAGLMGWALAVAKKERRFGLLLLTYAVSVVLHGLWNGMVILGVYASLGALAGSELLPIHFAISSWLVLLVLAAGCIILLVLNNRRLPRATTLA